MSTMSARARVLMTRDEFIDWFGRQRTDVYATPPYDVAPCRCGDLNCHGWRFVERTRAGDVEARESAGARR